LPHATRINVSPMINRCFIKVAYNGQGLAQWHPCSCRPVSVADLEIDVEIKKLFFIKRPLDLRDLVWNRAASNRS